MKLKKLFFDDFGVRPEAIFIGLVIGAMMLIVGIPAFLAFVSWRDCPTVCGVQEAEPVWTLANGCACAKNGDLTKPLARPVEVNLR